jgi:hypothetical protein
VKFLSSQTAQGQFIAESATQNEDRQDDIKLTSLSSLNISLSLFSFLFFTAFLSVVPATNCRPASPFTSQSRFVLIAFLFRAQILLNRSLPDLNRDKPRPL